MNKQWLLARTPPGGLPTDEDFTLVEAPIPEPGPNQMLARTIYLSLDPYQWGRKRSGLEAVGGVPRTYRLPGGQEQPARVQRG